MAVTASALGDFLRARREKVRPEDVGLVPEVLDAVARALRLDAKAMQHLHDLATSPGDRSGRPLIAAR